MARPESTSSGRDDDRALVVRAVVVDRTVGDQRGRTRGQAREAAADLTHGCRRRVLVHVVGVDEVVRAGLVDRLVHRRRRAGAEPHRSRGSGSARCSGRPRSTRWHRRSSCPSLRGPRQVPVRGIDGEPARRAGQRPAVRRRSAGGAEPLGVTAAGGRAREGRSRDLERIRRRRHGDAQGAGRALTVRARHVHVEPRRCRRSRVPLSARPCFRRRRASWAHSSTTRCTAWHPPRRLQGGGVGIPLCSVGERRGRHPPAGPGSAPLIRRPG